MIVWWQELLCQSLPMLLALLLLAMAGIFRGLFWVMEH